MPTKCQQTSLWEEIDLGDNIEITVGCTVECFSSKRKGIVIEIYKGHVKGDVALVADLENGNEMLPFLDKCKLIKPYIKSSKN